MTIALGTFVSLVNKENSLESNLFEFGDETGGIRGFFECTNMYELVHKFQVREQDLPSLHIKSI